MDIAKLMEQAQAMQQKMEKAAKEIQESEFVGQASNGLVKVIIDGENRVKTVNIDKSIINAEDKEMIEELIMIAMNDATNKLNQEKTTKMSNVTGGMKLPGM